MRSKGFEDLEVYRLAEAVADAIWGLVVNWGDRKSVV